MIIQNPHTESYMNILPRMSDHPITVQGHMTSEIAYIIQLALKSATQIFKGGKDRMEVDISGSMVCGLRILCPFPSNGAPLPMVTLLHVV